MRTRRLPRSPAWSAERARCAGGARTRCPWRAARFRTEMTKKLTKWRRSANDQAGNSHRGGSRAGGPVSGPSPRPGPGLDGVALVRTVATALVRLSRWRDVGDRVYADGVQSAYNHLVLRTIAGGGEPPASVPDMVTWAGRTPLA